jgi:hypothetical protein
MICLVDDLLAAMLCHHARVPFDPSCCGNKSASWVLAWYSGLQVNAYAGPQVARISGTSAALIRDAQLLESFRYSNCCQHGRCITR